MKDPFINRKYVIMALIVLATLGLLVRLFIIQVVKSSYRLSADNNVLRYITQYPARGLIYDRNGKLIVFNQAAYDLMVVPTQVSNIDTTGFCDLLGISTDLFRKQLRIAINYSRRAPSVFLKQVSNETYAKFQEKMFLYPGFYVQPRTLRKYSKPVAAHILGYVSEVDDGVINKNPYYKSRDYDPALLVGRVRSENFAKLQGDSILQPLFNRALMASYPPGSTFKPINGLIGLQEGVITPQTLFECHRGYLFVACHAHPSPLSIVGAIGNSCNAYFCQTYRRVLENPAYNTIGDAY